MFHSPRSDDPSSHLSRQRSARCGWSGGSRLPNVQWWPGPSGRSHRGGRVLPLRLLQSSLGRAEAGSVEQHPRRVPGSGDHMMLEADSPLRLNCPKCPRRMEYIVSPARGVYVYRCADHGEWQLGPGGLTRAPGVYDHFGARPECSSPESGQGANR
jgi:hypothetical protein